MVVLSNNKDDNGNGSSLGFVMRRCNVLTVVKKRSLGFLNVTNFMAPGFSYKRYIRVCECEVRMGFFSKDR